MTEETKEPRLCHCCGKECRMMCDPDFCSARCREGKCLHG